MTTRETGGEEGTDALLTQRLLAAAADVVKGPDSLLRFADAIASAGSAEARTAPVEELHLITFFLDREEFGIPITRAREILRVGQIARVPAAPQHIRGVTSVRGRIIPVVDVRTRLSLSPAEVTDRSRILLVDAYDRVLGLLVDSIAHILKGPTSSVTPPPDEIVALSTDYIRSVVRLPPRLIFLVDLDRLLLVHPSPAEPLQAMNRP
jgi:purine-binding chemotaxis protein CheW